MARLPLPGRRCAAQGRFNGRVMFTGLIADIGRVRRIERRGRDARLELATGLDTSTFELGESIAVNGVCLTVTHFPADAFSADASTETLARTSLGDLRTGSRVHLERALAVGDRLGGHIVQGHVDGVGTLDTIEPDGDAWQLTVSMAQPLRDQLVEKGSIAIDGVSLTVNALTPKGCRLTIVRFTADETHLIEGGAGRRVNIETDIIGKYVQQMVLRATGGTAKSGGLSDLLRQYGYLDSH